nr:MAG TPA: Head protein [Caudoviricetes sp.]
MAKRIAQSSLNASTIDILNVIRQNASYDYQQSVPVVEKTTQIPQIGEIICGTPALANQFLNALVNRIALVRAQSVTFNNPYSRLKKGYLEFGETVEDIFVSIAKVVDYNPDKGEGREFKRSLPDVRSQFHIMNWRVMYPVTIQDEDLRRAFLSEQGVTELIAKIVESVYTAAEYDEFLLFKYLIIKAVTKGQMYPVAVDNSDMKNYATAFRSKSNAITFPKTTYNAASVRNNTPRERQVIFMDSDFNAKYDVEVLAAAFNMDKATFMGSLFLIDDFTTFDNERFEVIRDYSDGIEEVTTDELNLMNDVKAVLLDENWFQCYDNMNKFTEKYVASGLYWNYFYHTWKTISSSQFANAIVFVANTATVALPATISFKVVDKSISETATVLCLEPQVDGATLEPHNVQLVQTAQATKAGVGVQKYGALLIPSSATATNLVLSATVNGTTYNAKASATINANAEVGATVVLDKVG